MPIRVRLALLAALGAVLLTSIGGWVFVYQLRSGLHSSLDASLRTRADALVQSVADAPGSEFNFQDSGSTHLLPANQSIAQVVSPSGHLIETSQAAGPHVLLPASTIAAARRATVKAEGNIPTDDHAVRFLATPVSRPDGRWVVIVGSSLDAADDAVKQVRSGILLGGSLMVVAAAGGAWLLATLALRPVERMRRQAARIGERDAGTRLPVPHTRDEIAELAATMNALLARLQSALSQQRAFVADAGHELRTPLAILRTELELATHPGRSVSDLRAAIAEAGEETERLTRLAEELLFLARHDEIGGGNARELQPLHPLLSRAVDNARGRAPNDIHIVLDASPDLVANVVGDDLGRAVSNLLDNALRHAAPGTAIELRAERAADDVVISVRDHGPGFPPDFLPHAFERFRRSDASRARADGGTGLGLAIVRAVAREHGGDADAFNQPDGGAEVRIRVPAGA